MHVRPVVLAVAAVQVLLPASLLVVRWAEEGSRPRTELGASWQMYTTAPEQRYLGVDADGSTRSLDAAGLPPVLREVAVGPSVPARLCARDPSLVAVVRETGPAPGRFAC
jgi:hypothetical protein